jgi:hypothetical protein
MGAAYPVKFSVRYPRRGLNRVSTFFRVFAAIPILVVAGAISGSFGSWGGDYNSYAGSAAGLLVLPPLLMILFRQKYPRWWFTWNQELMRFLNRIGVYLALMDDKYPSTDRKQSVTLNFTYPNVESDLNRWLPLVKWFLAIPHFIILAALYIGAFFAVIGAWFAILATGRYPEGIFRFVEGVFRWHNRVNAYALLMLTDEYPPFSFE